MQITLPRYYARRIWRAIIEFGLIERGDRILVGFSGGKDSLFLLYALKALQAKSPFPFTIGAVHVDLGFAKPSEKPRLFDFCNDIDIPLFWEETAVAKTAFQEGKNPCATCAYFRRAVVNKTAVEEGYNIVALAHHHDDAVETLLMSQLYSGQIQTLLPKTELDQSRLTVVRPLVYLRENKIREFVEKLPWQPMVNPCPVQGKTHRWKVKKLLEELTKENPGVYNNIAACLRHNPNTILWPMIPGRQELQEMHIRLMGPSEVD